MFTYSCLLNDFGKSIRLLILADMKLRKTTIIILSDFSKINVLSCNMTKNID